MNDFSFFSLCKSEDIKTSLNQLGMYTQSFSTKDSLLSKLFEQSCNVIVLHTDVGVDEVIDTLKLMKEEGLSSDVSLIIIADIKENKTLSADLKGFNVISTFTYENWGFQLKNLLKVLNVKSLSPKASIKIEEESVDPLTDVLNWPNALDIFNSLVNDYEESRRPFSLIMFDIDGFKDIVDEYGNDIGDEVLVSMSSIAQQNIRKYDTVLRVDKDIFAIFLSGANLEIAKTKAESFRYEMDIKGHGFDKVKATASFAVLEYEEGESLEGLSSKAYSLVSQAKEKGKNKLAF